MVTERNQAINAGIEKAARVEDTEAKNKREDRVHCAEGRRETTGRMEYTEAQREIADKAHALILENTGRHITITELAGTLHVSPTQVKVCFRKVYGAPVYSYARRYRMEKAAEILADTEDSILEIAGRFGYENGSKFARAFRSVIGVSPAEYRRRLRWERENPV